MRPPSQDRGCGLPRQGGEPSDAVRPDAVQVNGEPGRDRSGRRGKRHDGVQPPWSASSRPPLSTNVQVTTHHLTGSVSMPNAHLVTASLRSVRVRALLQRRVYHFHAVNGFPSGEISGRARSYRIVTWNMALSSRAAEVRGPSIGPADVVPRPAFGGPAAGNIPSIDGESRRVRPPWRKKPSSDGMYEPGGP
jgi:hypothetical protein